MKQRHDRIRLICFIPSSIICILLHICVSYLNKKFRINIIKINFNWAHFFLFFSLTVVFVLITFWKIHFFAWVHLFSAWAPPCFIPILYLHRLYPWAEYKAYTCPIKYRTRSQSAPELTHPKIKSFINLIKSDLITFIKSCYLSIQESDRFGICHYQIFFHIEISRLWLHNFAFSRLKVLAPRTQIYEMSAVIPSHFYRLLNIFHIEISRLWLEMVEPNL